MKYLGEILTKVATDVALGKAIVFSVAPAKEIVGIRNHRLGWWIRSCESFLNFGDGATARDEKGTREPGATKETGVRSVITHTD